MSTALTDMVIDEISLVDDPANEHARVEIVKRRKGDMVSIDKAVERLQARLAQTLGRDDDNSDADSAIESLLLETTMDLETLAKALEESEARLDTLENLNTELVAKVKSKDEEIAKLKKAGSQTEEEQEEEFLKGLPEVVRKRMEADRKDAQESRALVQKMLDEQETTVYLTKARALNVGDANVLGPILARVAKGKTTEKDLEVIESVLKAAGEFRKGSPLLRAVGGPGMDAGEPETILKSKTAEIRAANPGMTEAAAYEKALNENPALYDAVRNSRAG